MARKENQEICGCVLADLVEKAWYTANKGKTSSMTFRGIYDDKQAQGVLDVDEEVIGRWDTCRGRQKKHTVHE